jgi:hypothetical protein
MLPEYEMNIFEKEMYKTEYKTMEILEIFDNKEKDMLRKINVFGKENHEVKSKKLFIKDIDDGLYTFDYYNLTKNFYCKYFFKVLEKNKFNLLEN